MHTKIATKFASWIDSEQKVLLLARLYNLIVGPTWQKRHIFFLYSVVNDVCSQGFNLQLAIISENCDLVPNRHHARTWNSDNLSHWRIWSRRLFADKGYCTSTGLGVVFTQICFPTRAQRNDIAYHLSIWAFRYCCTYVFCNIIYIPRVYILHDILAETTSKEIIQSNYVKLKDLEQFQFKRSLLRWQLNTKLEIAC